MGVFWAALMERSVQDAAVMSLLRIAGASAIKGYTMMLMPYGRTDVTRNQLVRTFLAQGNDPADVLVMLDCDHRHPADIVERLAVQCSELIEVIGALAFRRGPPFDPCFFIRDSQSKQLSIPVELPRGLLRGTVVGTGAIAIRRSCFTKLDAAGFEWPYFRYMYAAKEALERGAFQSEDVDFALRCEAAGIPHYCDSTLETPHLITSEIDGEVWQNYLAENHSTMQTIDIPMEQVMPNANDQAA